MPFNKLITIAFYALMVHAQAQTQTRNATARVLIYSATAGFRHDSIPTAIRVLNAKGPSENVVFENTEDKAQFTPQKLASYDALLFLSTTGEVLDDTGKNAFQDYLNKGGNFMAVHSASDTLTTTAFYGREVGAYFDYHAELQDAVVDVIDGSHPSTEMLPAEWDVRDEMYNFKSDPRSVGATVVLSADESSYSDSGTRNFDQGKPHPIAWFQDRGAGVGNNGLAGRSFYTSLGHLNDTWEDNLFVAHVLGGLRWVLESGTTRATNTTALVGNIQSSNNFNPTGTSANQPTTSANSVPSIWTGGFSILSAFVAVLGVTVWYHLRV